MECLGNWGQGHAPRQEGSGHPLSWPAQHGKGARSVIFAHLEPAVRLDELLFIAADELCVNGTVLPSSRRNDMLSSMFLRLAANDLSKWPSMEKVHSVRSVFKLLRVCHLVQYLK